MASNSDLFSFDKNKIKVEGNLRPFSSDIKIDQLNMGRYLVSLYLSAPSSAPAPSFSVKLQFPKENINQLWNSKTWSNKSHFSMPSYDRAAADFTIISGLTINDQNQVTFTYKDDYKNRFINAFVEEEADTIVFALSLFENSSSIPEIIDYELQILVDLRNIHFSEAISDASKWRLEEQFSNIKSHVDTSMVPMFSTWYPMHRNIPLENISRELDSLSQFNFKSIMIDDGWRKLVKMKEDTSYIFEDESHNTMLQFNQKRKDLGLKLYLWYSLPFLGRNPVISSQFEGKYIQYKAPKILHVLDPRYPDVRRYLMSTYYNFYRNWKFEGFWFDFTNQFYPRNLSSITEDLGRDYVDIPISMDKLLKQISARLKLINPNVFLGNNFIPVGPNINTNQNLLGGFVGISSTNIIREKMVNNRILYGEESPFMEIMAVHNRDKSPDVARKFQSIMFGNPYISFFITTMPEDNKQAIRFWLNYWKRNYDVLMKGDFHPIKVSRNYPAIHVEDENKIIYNLYNEFTLVLPLNLTKTMDVINAKESEIVSFLSSTQGLSYQYSIFNHLGNKTSEGTLKTKKKNKVEFEVPEGGFIRFLPND